MAKKIKAINYQEPQYHIIKNNIKEIPWMQEMLEKYTIIASKKKEPLWYVKYASLYLTYENKYYRLNPDDINTSAEIFDELVEAIIDDIYELGAYDMIYTGMMD